MKNKVDYFMQDIEKYKINKDDLVSNAKLAARKKDEIKDEVNLKGNEAKVNHKVNLILKFTNPSSG